MPAMLDDPDSPAIYRVSGALPYPDPAHPAFPHTIVPRHVTLRDRQTVATVIPFASRHQVPESLLRYLGDQFNKEIEGGDTYPMMDPLPFDKFASYWFQNFGAIMLLGHIESPEDVVDGKDWSKECLGTFYIKPNYPGRSSHVCNAGFIVTDASRNRGVGRLMGESYLEWAPKLGYTYSVFNLVYETNVASCKIWDALGFKRIGRVKACGNLKSYPDRLVDAIMFGRDLGDAAGGAGSEELVSEERFDKIKFYLKYGRYPNGADRAEKSRLRSAATHYKLLDGDVLMLKDKEVISDPQRQYDIARGVHNQVHAGINKTTATIAERYHWSRIKETVSDVIRNCAECKELGKTSSAAQTQQPSPSGVAIGAKRPNLNPSAGASSSKRSSPSPSSSAPPVDLGTTNGSQPRPSLPSLSDPSFLNPYKTDSHHQYPDASADLSSIIPLPTSHPLHTTADTTMADHDIITRHTHNNPMLQDPSHGPLHPSHQQHHTRHPHQHHSHMSNTHQHVTLPPLNDPHAVSAYQPIDPQIISQTATDPLHHHHHHHHPHYAFDHPSPQHHHPHAHDPDADTFQALLNAADDDDDDPDVDVDTNQAHHSSHASLHHHPHHHADHAAHHTHQRTREEDEAEKAAVDRDLEMLIEPQEDDDEDEVVVPSVGHVGTGDGGAMDIDVIAPGSGPGGSANSAVGGGSGGRNVLNTSASGGGGGGGSSSSSSRAAGHSGSGKMDVSHLLSAHDEDDDDDGIDLGGGLHGGGGQGRRRAILM